MRDYVCCLTFNNLAKKKIRVQGSGLVWKIGKKKNTRRRKGGGGSRDGCLFPSNIFYSAFIFRYDDLFLA